MAYAVPPSPGKQRPTSVTVAVALMFGILAAQVIGLIISFLPNPELEAATEAFLDEHPELGDTVGGDPAANAAAIIIPAVVIIGFGVLAFFVSKGNRPARIVTWVLSGLGVVCLFCTQLLLAAAPTLLTNAAGSGDEQVDLLADYYELVSANTPDWQEQLSFVLGGLSLVALILVIILLAVPSANEFFRKEEQLWVPPTAPPGPGGFPQFPPPAGPQNPPSQ